jgi:O-acetyl-ADP-ribose deacetylase (regulator of RNase III)
MPPKQAPPAPAAVLQSTTYNDTLIQVIQGDIVTFPVGAVVNAADATSLLAGNREGGGGLDAQIHAAAGPSLAAELIDRYQSDARGVGVGGAYLSEPHNIQTTQHIIHATGPDYTQAASSQKAIQQLRAAYHMSLTVAGLALHVRSIAFPALSTGTFGFPHDLAARTAMAAVREFLDNEGEELFDRVVFLIRPGSQENFDAYNNNFA